MSGASYYLNSLLVPFLTVASAAGLAYSSVQLDKKRTTAALGYTAVLQSLALALQAAVLYDAVQGSHCFVAGHQMWFYMALAVSVLLQLLALILTIMAAQKMNTANGNPHDLAVSNGLAIPAAILQSLALVPLGYMLYSSYAVCKRA